MWLTDEPSGIMHDEFDTISKWQIWEALRSSLAARSHVDDAFCLDPNVRTVHHHGLDSYGKLCTYLHSNWSFAPIRVYPLTNLNGTSCYELVPCNFPYNINKFFPLVMMHDGRQCLNLKWRETYFARFIEGQTCFSASWHAQMSLTLNELI